MWDSPAMPAPMTAMPMVFVMEFSWMKAVHGIFWSAPKESRTYFRSRSRGLQEKVWKRKESGPAWCRAGAALDEQRLHQHALGFAFGIGEPGEHLLGHVQSKLVVAAIHGCQAQQVGAGERRVVVADD